MAVPWQLILQGMQTLGDSAAKRGGSGGGGFGQVWSNVGNRDVKKNSLQALFNTLDFGGGLTNTIAAWGGKKNKIFGGQPPAPEEPQQIVDYNNGSVPWYSTYNDNGTWYTGQGR